MSRVLESDLAFPEFDGTILTHLERKVERAAKALGYCLPTATAFRKEVEIRNKRLAEPIRKAVSRSMSHSHGTAATYYQAPTSKDSYATYRTIVDLIDGERGKSPTPEVSEEEDRVVATVSKRKKRTYDDEEDKEEDENGQAVLLRQKGKGKAGVPTKGKGRAWVPIHEDEEDDNGLVGPKDQDLNEEKESILRRQRGRRGPGRTGWQGETNE